MALSCITNNNIRRSGSVSERPTWDRPAESSSAPFTQGETEAQANDIACPHGTTGCEAGGQDPTQEGCVASPLAGREELTLHC